MRRALGTARLSGGAISQRSHGNSGTDGVSRGFDAAHGGGLFRHVRFTAASRLAFAEPGRSGFWLALMRRPAGQPDDVEGGADAAVGIGEAFARRSRAIRSMVARRVGVAPPLDHDVGRAHAPEIAPSARRRCRSAPPTRSTSVTGSAKPARCNSAPTSRRSANGATRGDTPPSHSASACGEGLPQFGQRIAADHRRQQQPVGLERAPDLRQHAGQIVDELKGQRGDREVERFRRQRQRLRIVGDRCALIDLKRSAQRRCEPIRPASRYRRHRKIRASPRPAAQPCPRRRDRAGTLPARRAARDPAARATARGRTGRVLRSGLGHAG